MATQQQQRVPGSKPWDGPDAEPPAWVKGEMEAPAGEVTIDGCTFARFTEDQQMRLGVDAEGNKVSTSLPPPPPDFPLKHVLVTGGLGFIGSHTTIELLKAGAFVTIIDNLCNSKLESLHRIMEIAKSTNVAFYNADINDGEALDKIFQGTEKFDSCIHFAALKAVGESVREPMLYYSNNVGGTLTLLKKLAKYDCKSIVFSSSATVYGTSLPPLSETSPTGTGITNPYGQTKHMMEQIISDLYRSDNEWGVVLLRYFNPVGAHPSGRIGEDPAGIPNNLMPYVQQVAVGKRPHLNVFGDDYDTPDGTGVRDYIHVVDLAEGHLAALRFLAKNGNKGRQVFNLGSGTGNSVLEVVAGMKAACGHDVPYKIAPRREGDLANLYADPSKAFKLLGWKTQRDMKDMCADSWRWIHDNPSGFPAEASCPGGKVFVGLFNTSVAAGKDMVQVALKDMCAELGAEAVKVFEAGTFATAQSKAMAMLGDGKTMLSFAITDRASCVNLAEELGAAGFDQAKVSDIMTTHFARLSV